MSFELSIAKPGTLNIIYMGTINREQISSVRENAIAMINANGLNNILCDIRDASLNLKIVDLLNFDASSKPVNPEIKKTAVVYDPENTKDEDLKLYRDMAQERGFIIRFYNDFREAKSWLEN